MFQKLKCIYTFLVRQVNLLQQGMHINGATAFRITTFSITTLSIVALDTAECCYAEWHSCLVVANKSCVLSVVILIVVIPNVVMLSVILLSVVAKLKIIWNILYLTHT
jgi:hypothetical protein